MQPQIVSLKNGLTIIFVDTKAFPTLTTLLVIGAGSRYENEKNNGIAHFFEHMAFKGSKKYPNSFVISSTIEGKGGIFNAFTAKDHTGYWIKATSKHFKTIIDVLADMVLNPKLLEEEIAREKGVIIEEINMYEDMPQNKVSELFENLIFKDNSLGYDIIGKKETVSNFSRQTFVDYMQQLYHPANAVLVVAGGLTQNSKLKAQNHNLKLKTNNTSDKYLRIIEDKFSKWENKATSGFKKVIESQTKSQQLIKYKKTEQTHFCLGFRTFSFFDKRKYALSLLATILGGGMSSRLFMQVRERRGLCYYIATGRNLYHDIGCIVTQAGVSNDLDKIKLSIKVALEEHKKISQGDVKKDELERAKELVKGRLLLSLEDSHNVAAFFGTKKILENSTKIPAEVITEIDAVGLEDIISLAKDIFQSKKLNFSLVGPFRNLKMELSI